MSMYKVLYKALMVFLFQFIFLALSAQNASVIGKVFSDGKAVAYADVGIYGTNVSTLSDSLGFFKLQNLGVGSYVIQVSYIGYKSIKKSISLKKGEILSIDFNIGSSDIMLNEVVVTGTLKEVSRIESPVPVEVYSSNFFKKNPTPNIYEALQNVNGIRPQLNCQVCNTGDIHINGLEGPYTMVLLDGMPIVSSLSTVYGLSGIPNSLVERVEVVKGPASSLYGSEAVGGLINIITKKPQNAAVLSADVFCTSWGEINADLGFKFNVGSKSTALTGLNYFNFQNKVDNNNDNFTDMTLQNRISIFQKWSFQRKENRLFSLAARYMYEDRWGGDMKWESQFRGSDSIYGESIYTSRWEVLGSYQLPTKEKLLLSFSYNDHNQNSRYGTTVYNAQQNIAFSQLTWDKKRGIHDFLLGTAIRYTYYDDNTPATKSIDTLNPINQPQKTWLPGVFIQDEIGISKNHKLLLGLRYDYNSYHGNIFTPRFAYKWTVNDKNILRLNAGTGFRVVNLFTEDHAALTGARIVEIKNELNPEQSYNINLNYIKKIYSTNGNIVNIDASAFYTYFKNRIVGDYDLDPNKIIYDNLNGFAVSKGISLNLDFAFNNGLKVIAGGTVMQNTLTEDGVTQQQILTEKFTSTWMVSYRLASYHLTIDYTGNVYSPMRLPLLSELDPRSPYSPWWSIQNLQMTYDGFRNIQFYGGIKNLLNWTPNRGNPFIIARSNDPFDKRVQYGSNGQVLATADNPYALTFDPSYIFGPNQGVRVFIGFRYSFR